jgi:enamine deaminase RidA (YjgF/YER057c/UK114 family)
VRYENPPELGTPLGLYSQLAATRGDDLYFVAGQLADVPEGGHVPFADQVTQVFRKIQVVLDLVGSRPTDVVQFTTYVVDPRNLALFHERRREVFSELYPSGAYPPNTLVVVAGLVKPECLVEVQTVIAIAPDLMPGRS